MHVSARPCARMLPIINPSMKSASDNNDEPLLASCSIRPQPPGLCTTTLKRDLASASLPRAIRDSHWSTILPQTLVNDVALHDKSNDNPHNTNHL